MPRDERVYYRGRAATEMGMAERAIHPKAIAAHYELADAYSQRAGAAVLRAVERDHA